MSDLEEKKQEEEIPKSEATEEKKQEMAPAAESEAIAESEGAEGEQEEEKKPQVAPRVHISNPSSGAAYPFNSKLPIDIECEGSGEFNGQLQLRNSQGKLVYDEYIWLKMGPENKGHLQTVIDLNALMEGATDRSGTYQLHAFGADKTGLQAPMARINLDLLDEEKAKTPNMPKDVANAPGEGGAGDAA